MNPKERAAQLACYLLIYGLIAAALWLCFDARAAAVFVEYAHGVRS